MCEDRTYTVVVECGIEGVHTLTQGQVYQIDRDLVDHHHRIWSLRGGRSPQVCDSQQQHMAIFTRQEGLAEDVKRCTLFARKAVGGEMSCRESGTRTELDAARELSGLPWPLSVSDSSV